MKQAYDRHKITHARDTKLFQYEMNKRIIKYVNERIRDLEQRLIEHEKLKFPNVHH